MRFSATVIGFVAATCLTLSPAVALAGGASSKPSSKPASAGKPPSVKPATGKPTTTGASSMAKTSKPASKPTTTVVKPAKAPSVKPTSAKPVKSTTVAAKSTAAPKSTTKAAKSSTHTTKSTDAPKSAHKSKSSATGTTTTTPGTTLPMNPIAEKIASKPNLSAKLTGMLPIDPLTGRTMTLDAASLGFKNQGQFIAALHVSQNLGIPFTELKSHMVTVTPGAPGEPPTATQTGSLGQAIQASKASANVTTEVQRAETQANTDLQDFGLAVPKKTVTTKGGAR